MCKEKKLNRILFCGVSELAEIASLRVSGHGLQVIGTFDPHSELTQFLHLPVWKSIKKVDEYDVCLLTELNNPSMFYKSLIEEVGKEKVMVPSILGVNHRYG